MRTSDKTYAGIGSRDISKEIEELIYLVGKGLAKEGWHLNSGGATGSDFAFERGCDEVAGTKTIFLPWKNFGNKWDRKASSSDIVSPSKNAVRMAKDLFEEFREVDKVKDYNPPDWHFLLFGRNMHQILGENLNRKVCNVVCYTKDAKDVGGTRWALRIARKHEIKIYNLGDLDTRKRFEKWLKIA